MSGRLVRTTYRVAIALAFAGVVGLLGWSPRHAPAAPMVECPHMWDTLVTLKEQRSPNQTYPVPAGGIPHVGIKTNVPEFHDCQRFVIGNTYGPLVAIFSALYLDSIAGRLDSIARGQKGRGSSIRQSLAVAVIFNQGPEEYLPLGLKPGFSCLRVFYANGLPNAKVQFVDMRPDRCIPEYDASTAEAHRLDARVSPLWSVLQFSKDDFPDVARWEWDPMNRNQYISVLCGETVWCEVGANNFRSAAPDMESVLNTDESRVRRIKGWYDEQQMDVMNRAGKLVPSNVHAAVIPHPDLKNRLEADFDTGWVLTGYIAIDSDRREYWEKLGIRAVRPGASLESMNTIEMCKGRHASCDIVQERLRFNSTCTRDMWAADTVSWWARIRASTDLGARTPTYKYFCVIRREHPDLTMGAPGTARWRWLDDDPTVWESCDRACCEVQAKLQ